MSWENTLKKQEFPGLFVKAELYLELSRESMRYFFAKLSATYATEKVESFKMKQGLARSS